jgi:hypothetical protein
MMCNPCNPFAAIRQASLAELGRFSGSGHDIDIYVSGRDNAPAVAEVKARKKGGPAPPG